MQSLRRPPSQTYQKKEGGRRRVNQAGSRTNGDELERQTGLRGLLCPQQSGHQLPCGWYGHQLPINARVLDTTLSGPKKKNVAGGPKGHCPSTGRHLLQISEPAPSPKSAGLSAQSSTTRHPHGSATRLSGRGILIHRIYLRRPAHNCPRGWPHL